MVKSNRKIKRPRCGGGALRPDDTARARVPAPVNRLARRLVRDAEEEAEREEQGERDPP